MTSYFDVTNSVYPVIFTTIRYSAAQYENLLGGYELSTMGVSKESISEFLIGNRFHVKLRILSPKNCKQSLQVKSWKAEVTAEKKQTQDYN